MNGRHLMIGAWAVLVGGLSPATAATPLALEEPAGIALLAASTARADYGSLAQVFETQANLAYCGVASTVMVLNSLRWPAPEVPGYGPYRFWTQLNLFTPEATRAVLAPEQVAREGMTLQQLQGLLRSHGLQAQRLHGDQLSVVALRTLLRRSLADPADRLLVNYDRRGLGQEGSGHIAPLAAYNAHSDQVLILDVARYRYPAVWVAVTDLWQAINTVDTSSGRSRGLVVVRPSTNE
ncbi:MAG: phytochelatin synthase family protein [Cyanobacteriota bacterium]|nr:phytochelatin synthase family protein [Cyanobacteriota bacterium]